MTYLVTEDCIRCKYTDCAEVCPVDCFYEGENMLVINPEECIDCGVCEPECPIDAIKPESENYLDFIEINKSFSAIWPRITKKKAALSDADLYINEKEKYKKYFDPAPAKQIKSKPE